MDRDDYYRAYLGKVKGSAVNTYYGLERYNYLDYLFFGTLSLVFFDS